MKKFANFIRSPVKFARCEACNLFPLERIFPSRLAYESIPLGRKEKRREKSIESERNTGKQRRHAQLITVRICATKGGKLYYYGRIRVIIVHAEKLPR